MLRIVKMVFTPGEEEKFLGYFHASAPKIRSFPGCLSLELLRDKDHPNVFFTYSQWEKEQDLQAYRKSDLFSSTWARVKPLFQSRAEAWSVDSIWNE